MVVYFTFVEGGLINWTEISRIDPEALVEAFGRPLIMFFDDGRVWDYILDEKYNDGWRHSESGIKYKELEKLREEGKIERVRLW